MSGARILVTDGEQRAALATVRSLGHSGYEVYVCSTGGRSLAGASRHARADFATPDPLAEPEHYAGSVERLCRAHGIDVLVPITEPALLALLPARERIGARTPFAGLEAFRRISDKALITELAPSVGIAVPDQCVLDAAPAARRLRPDALRFPLVVKPARSVGEAGGRRSKLGVRHAADWRELEAVLDELPVAGYPVLLQQRVVGPGVGIFLLVWDGRVMARFAHRRLREKPPAGGVSVYREAIPADPALVDRSSRLLAQCGWQGAAMIEYKLDAATGTPYLMEINGRFWGSLQLAIDAGVDFPTLLVRLALGEQPEPVADYRTGVRSRWWWGDVDHLLARFRSSDRQLALPPDAPSRTRAVLDFLTLWRPGDRNEILRWNDPRPFVRETMQWIRGR